MYAPTEIWRNWHYSAFDIGHTNGDGLASNVAVLQQPKSEEIILIFIEETDKKEMFDYIQKVR